MNLKPEPDTEKLFGGRVGTVIPNMFPNIQKLFCFSPPYATVVVLYTCSSFKKCLYVARNR